LVEETSTVISDSYDDPNYDPKSEEIPGQTDPVVPISSENDTEGIDHEIKPDTEQDTVSDSDHLEKLIQELGVEKLEDISELFIPLDELNIFSIEQLNRLNESAIIYLDQFLRTPLTSICSLLNLDDLEALSHHHRVRDIVMNDANPVMKKFRALGRIRDNSLYYTTIPVTQIKGIGEATERKLKESEIESITDLANVSIKSLKSSSGFSLRKVAEFICTSRALVYERINIVEFDLDNKSRGDPSKSTQLDEISGIDLNTMNQLYGIGINNLEKLDASDPVFLGDQLNRSPIKILTWIIESQVYRHNRINVQYRILLA